MRERHRARAALVAVVVVTGLVPLVQGHDSFPLSTYPMYAGARADTDVFSFVVGVDADGARLPLSLGVIARTDDALVAQAEVDSRVAGGDADGLCTEVAARVPDDVARVEVVTERHDLVTLATGGDSTLDRTIHASCEPAT